MGKRFQIYKTTNLRNGKIYIGQHVCDCGKCSYIGSGSLILKAISKYGIESFKKEILFTFQSFEEMNKKEAELVNEDFISRPDTYNLQLGGRRSVEEISEETRKKMSQWQMGKKLTDAHKEAISKGSRGKKLSSEHVEKISLYQSNRTSEHVERISKSLRGKKHSLDRKRKISNARKMNGRISFGNKDLLKIDPETNEIVDRFYYPADANIGVSNIKAAIKRNGLAGGFKWKVEE